METVRKIRTNVHINQNPIWFLISLVLALAQLRLVLLVFGQNYIGSIQAAQGVVDGLPHWLIFQSRILGPYLVEMLSKFTGNFTNAYFVYFLLTTTVSGFLLLKFITNVAGVSKAWSAIVMFELLFALLLNNMWLFAWDHIDIIVFMTFVYFVVSGKNFRWFVGLFIVAVLNHESAMFIALWMVVSPIVDNVLSRRKNLINNSIDWKMITAGVFCVILGVVLIHFLRTQLLVKEIGPELWNQQLSGKNLHVHFSENITFLKMALNGSNFWSDLVVPAYILFILALASVLSLKDPRTWLALSITHVVLIASLLVYGVLSETRIMLELIPFIIFGLTALTDLSVKLNNGPELIEQPSK